MEDLRDFYLSASHQFQSSLLGFLEILSQFIGEVRQAWSLDCSDSHTEFVSGLFSCTVLEQFSCRIVARDTDCNI